MLSIWWLAIPIACVSWTVTKEELFKDFRLWCAEAAREERSWFWCKFFYIWTCEYCVSHWAAVGVVVFTDCHLWFSDWRGYGLAGFVLVAAANLYMVVFNILRQTARVLSTLCRD